MIVVILFGIVVAMALALALARFAPPRAAASTEPPDLRPRLPSAELRALAVELLSALGLSVVEEELLDGDQRRLIAAQDGGELPSSRYVVFLEPRPPGDLVDPSLLVELAEYVKSERAAAGMLITPYSIESGGLAGVEVPIELIDGTRLTQLVSRHLPARLDELRRFRGFGATSVATVPEPA
jgi:hypothetical protein